LRISTPEFVAIMAMLVATVALSTDGILPALTMIANDMTPDDHNRAQFVLSFFVVGMAAGTFVMGPLSDSFGRKRVIYSGAVMYIFCALICATTDNYNLLLLARIGQGIGAAAPRVVAQALIRDFYQGREMARISSFVMIIFASVPALAPLLGSFVMLAFEWQAIFGLFILFVAISTIWMAVRIDESMPAHKRIPFRVRTISAAVKEVLKYSVIVTSIIGLIFAYCILFVAIFLVQPVFDQVYDRSASFPYWFALIAILSASSSVLNSQLVVRLGMRALINAAFRVQAALSIAMLLLWYIGVLQNTIGFAFFVIWIFSLFFMAGMTIGNLTALAMEPVGHIAGTAASVISALATIGSVIFAAILGQFFDGTLFVMIFGVAVFAVLGAIVVHRLKRFERPNKAS
jgi:DHA1 family bicyclomycin/chloramphenicol resistance-like MFS transporter